MKRLSRKTLFVAVGVVAGAAISLNGSLALRAAAISTSTSRIVTETSIKTSIKTSIVPTKWRQFVAWKLSDGRTQALVVPAIGRVMSYGLVGGRNWLWQSTLAETNAAMKNLKNWHGWGGAQLWLAPQGFWSAISDSGSSWPPDFTWDHPSFPHSHRVLEDGFFRIISPISPRSGSRLVRDFGFHNGDFVVRQTVEKVSGAPLMASLWSVTGIGETDLNVLPINRQSVYRNNYHLYGAQSPNVRRDIVAAVRAQVSDDLLLVRRGQVPALKIGVDSPIAAIAAIRDGEVLVQRANRQSGEYPDGAAEAGFPVEWYDGGNKPGARAYSELELLSPLRLLQKGARWTQSVHWNVHALPVKTAPNAPANLNAIRRWFRAPLK